MKMKKWTMTAKTAVRITRSLIFISTIRVSDTSCHKTRTDGVFCTALLEVIHTVLTVSTLRMILIHPNNKFVPTMRSTTTPSTKEKQMPPTTEKKEKITMTIYNKNVDGKCPGFLKRPFVFF